MNFRNPLSFDAILMCLDGPMLHHVIPVPKYITDQVVDKKGSTRILCSVEGGDEFPCALIPRHGDYVIAASKKLIREHKLVPDVPFKVNICPDPDDGLSLPEELQEALNQDLFAAEIFDALKDGYKRGYIYYVRQAKSIDTRIKRSLEILEKIKLRA